MSDVFFYSGAGNTFALVDNREGAPGDSGRRAQALCRQNKVDGLLVMEKAVSGGDIRMRIFNPDGSEAEMCGNGSRCAAFWAHANAGFQQTLVLETGAGKITASVNGNSVQVHLTDPEGPRDMGNLHIDGETHALTLINTGVPHAVTFVKNLPAFDVRAVGQKIRMDARFRPKGANASFYELLGNGRIRSSTYERGVEAQTASCGTGSVACALVAAAREGLASPIQIETLSGEKMQVFFSMKKHKFYNIILEGPVRPHPRKEKIS
jgi:diaminopimelate epimerase